jgi:hypothetical protein
VSSIDNAMALAGYTRVATHSGQACRNCAHGQARASGLRCLKGGYYVVPAGSCRHYEPQGAVPAEDHRLQIGPTDV